MHRHDKGALEFDVTHCRFAEFFLLSAKPQLGALLVCATHFDVAGGGNEVSLRREQTLMHERGLARTPTRSCTFRYTFTPRA